ncbi:MAG: hypothetical protein ISS31_08950 [Kiritimatiellae bacterium]|nr:hypothetical protein [Kiritimatiellia bacterium]
MQRRDLVLDGLAFVVTVGLAAWLGWEAKDLIWGLWVSSLCVGYAYIVTTIVMAVVQAEGVGRVVMGGVGVFMLAFFTVHFGMFHYVHSVFLNGFFPLIEEGKGFPSLPVVLTTALREYWPIVVATFVSRWTDFPFRQKVSLSGQDTMMKPYANVIRMHLLIFVFAGLHAAGLSRYAVYPVLIAYFFPWGVMLRRVRGKEA